MGMGITAATSIIITTTITIIAASITIAATMTVATVTGGYSTRPVAGIAMLAAAADYGAAGARSDTPFPLCHGLSRRPSSGRSIVAFCREAVPEPAPRNRRSHRCLVIQGCANQRGCSFGLKR